MSEENVIPENNPPSQFRLLTTRRFSPYFFTQFLGAFNDNAFKSYLLIFIAFTAHQSGNDNPSILINISAGLFILPFFLFSSTAGQLADKFDMADLIRRIKIFEIVIMFFAAIAFYFNAIYCLVALLFLMGTQSAFFGPLKYAILPRHLEPQELVGGNGLVEMGTFVAILGGTILGGLIIGFKDSWMLISICLVSIALLGWLSSRGIPTASSSNSELVIDWNPVTATIDMFVHLKDSRLVTIVIMANTWFWFLGATYLTQLPLFVKDVLYAGNGVVTLLLSLFTIGVAIGSLACERLSQGKVEYGLISLGLLGLSVFGIDLYFASEIPFSATARDVPQFISTVSGIRLMLDLVFIGVFGGLYIVPLYTILQTEVPVERRARIFALNNIFNALLMVASAILGIIVLGVLEASIPSLLLIVATGNIVVAVALLVLLPEFATSLISFLSRLVSQR